MFPIRTALCALLALGLSLGPTEAEARFGKRSRPSQSDSNDRDRDDKKEHGASAIGSDDDDDRPRRSSRRRSSSGRRYVSDGGASFSWFSFLFVTGNHRLSVAPELRGERHAAALAFRVGAQGGSLSETDVSGSGFSGDLFLGLEGRRFGVDLRLTGLGLPTDDGTSGSDVITLTQSHLTWALISHERARLRVEAGVSTATAPDISFVGASFAASLEACIAGPLDLEARLQVTPFPYRQLDASAALAVHLGALVLRGGYRGMVLDDAGYTDGIANVDTFHGPFLGVGLSY
ncbi:hypothetical protein [Corallococcus macrosporus]|uniref:Outer membrane protein beta-barrel domain-containing protein n=1 Tax=Corallococcus macrosporus DSM 14697 TaxID=1189310 RepID=A0A250K5N8_9BACT|nr:hypothetical protein [Corallococcus macrosporus]ATB51077.1 hypothetical protein MYMAC_006734 [Corallococcus macrosporus DSM 14697]